MEIYSHQMKTTCSNCIVAVPSPATTTPLFLVHLSVTCKIEEMRSFVNNMISELTDRLVAINCSLIEFPGTVT